MNIILLGAPGSGKGTQGERIASDYNLDKLSTGDLLRAEIFAKTELGNSLKSMIESGLLVPDEVVISIVVNKIKNQSTFDGFLFDGFPRTLEQAKALDVHLTELKRSIDLVINFEVSEDDLVARLSNRYSCAKCKASYNKVSHNPKVAGVCDYCGGTEFYVREDDKPEVIKKRFVEYKRLTEPLLAYYSSSGLLRSVEATGDIEQVAKKVKLVIDKEILS